MRSITVYAYDPTAKEYRGTAEATEDPKHPGRYLIPAFATTLEPPAPGENQKVVWYGQDWQLDDIPQPEPEPEPTEEALRQGEMWHLEALLSERQNAYMKLFTTGANETELAECKSEIRVILDALEVLYNAESA